MSGMGNLSFRELPSAEWPRLAAVVPFDEAGLPLDNGHWRVLVAEIDGEIVGCTSVHTQVHWDPWWVAPKYRGNGGVIRGLIRQGAELLLDLDIHQVFCTIDDGNILSQAQATRLGFEPAPGKLYLLDLPHLGDFTDGSLR